MKELISTPIFGILISLIAFQIGCFINSKIKIALLNPLLISIILVIGFLLKFNISLEDYNKGGSFISFLLGPATVVLAVPLYKKIDLLKKNFIPIIVGIIAGSTIGMISIILLCYLFNLDSSITLSLVPKSVTAPIGIEIAKQLGGMPPLALAAIVPTGILGAIISPWVLKIARINNKVAKGVSIGTSSHGIGTGKAIELGETEGAMSGLSIGLAGLITVILSPIIVKLLSFLIK
ncbi:inner membrane protein YohK [Clostridium homopropionicum DSM 5847]|uniref:Inner membrane protein YohK n=1 Tax=Clostridium homopropionicum DSM 5847 TaxID=1121318 RepID=A0A0L6Z809_9CLOT|nr:LrgB family protein [Clostridium homopropionicum]KOA19100.1 inner membrane protein YohK [Clostridium homopropionicum DSM 5847]SFG83637.1 TIGR00659 family protein [Clostridium homopropionicum]